MRTRYRAKPARRESSGPSFWWSLIISTLFMVPGAPIMVLLGFMDMNAGRKERGKGRILGALVAVCLIAMIFFFGLVLTATGGK